MLAAKVVAHPVAAHVPVLLAAASTSSGLEINGGFVAQLVQFGFLGAVFVDVVGFHKFLVPRWSVDSVEKANAASMQLKDELIARINADIVELKNANKQLQELTQERLIPALVQATDVSRAYVAELARRNDRERRRGDDPRD